MSDLTLETISPKVAESYLGTMVGNRHLNQARVKTMAEDIKAGKWIITGESIKFDEDGHLFDGQHRLSACIRANKNFQTFVARNMSKHAFLVVDQGSKRTFGNYLQIKGYSSANNLAALTTLTYKYYSNQDWKNTPTMPQLETWFRKNEPGLLASITATRTPYKYLPKGVGLQPFASIHFILAREYGPDEAESFIMEVAESPTAPATVAVVKALKNKGRAFQDRAIPSYMSLALFIKAANSWLLGEEVEIIRWNPGGAKPESYPKLISPDSI